MVKKYEFWYFLHAYLYLEHLGLGAGKENRNLPL